MTPLETLERAEAAIARSSGEVNEHALVTDLRRGDAEAFAVLFSLYRERIYNFVARLVGDSEDAKDVTQEIFLKAFKQLPDNGAELALRPWLYRVATTTCLDHLRARKRRAQTTPMDTWEFTFGTDLFEQAETTHLVEECLRRLSDRHRLVLVLKDLHGLRHDEISEILGVSRGATETLLFRARAAFRETFLQLSPPVESRPAATSARRAALSVAGLGAFLPQLPLPASLHTPSGILASLSSAGAGTTATTGAGILAKLAAAVSVKAAVIATAATMTVAGVGVTTAVVVHNVNAEVKPAVTPRASTPGALTDAALTAATAAAQPPRGSSPGQPGASRGDTARGRDRSQNGLVNGRSQQAPGQNKLPKTKATGQGKSALANGQGTSAKATSATTDKQTGRTAAAAGGSGRHTGDTKPAPTPKPPRDPKPAPTHSPKPQTPGQH